MSKIYEALRQAELDRADKKSVNAAPSGGPAVLEPAVLQEAVFTPEVRAFEPLGPTLRHSGEKSVGGALAEMPLAEKPFREADLIEHLPGIAGFDPAKAARHVWHPNLQLLPALEERGATVEQFRSLRSRMQEFRDLNKLKSILVSSGLPQEGKSFVAANLAASFAKHKGGRVLLVDGDMRRATLHKVFGTPQGPGLTEFLSGDRSLDDIIQIPQPPAGHELAPGLASLSFIASGMEHDKAGDLSGSRRFEELLHTVKPYFDWIIVDSSPVNLVSDGVNLARACDGVLLVARNGITKYEVAQRAVAELKASKVLGVVLNAVLNPPLAGGYYGYEGYDAQQES